MHFRTYYVFKIYKPSVLCKYDFSNYRVCKGAMLQ